MNRKKCLVPIDCRPLFKMGKTMYVRAITLPVQPGKTDEAIRLFRDSVAPIFQKQEVFKAGYLVGARNTGKTMSFSLWETEADATVMDTSGAYQQWTALLAPRCGAHKERWAA